jgi:hypothetical protein
MPRPLYPRERTPVLIAWEVRERDILSLPTFEPRIAESSAYSLYRLRHPSCLKAPFTRSTMSPGTNRRRYCRECQGSHLRGSAVSSKSPCLRATREEGRQQFRRRETLNRHSTVWKPSLLAMHSLSPVCKGPYRDLHVLYVVQRVLSTSCLQQISLITTSRILFSTILTCSRKGSGSLILLQLSQFVVVPFVSVWMNVRYYESRLCVRWQISIIWQDTL